MNIKSIITAALALLISTACSGGAKQEKVMNKDGKSLVVFFSHAGDNYAVRWATRRLWPTTSRN